MQYEVILHHVGAFGKYQMLMLLIMVLITMPASFHFIVHVFVAAKTDHWCVVSDSQAINCSQLNSLAECQEEQKTKSIPYELDQDGNKVYSSCERYVMDDEDTGSGQGLNSTDVIPCDNGWDFDRSRYKSTIIEDFSLVCDRELLPDIAESVWFAGVLVGSFVWGTVGDWIGRRKTLIICLLLACISSNATAFVPNFAAYTATRFIAAACIYGSSLMTFIIVNEIVGPRRRVMANMIHFSFSSISHMLLFLLAFLLREWRHLLLSISLPYVLIPFLCICLPESPRWLISKNKFKEATGIIEKMAKVNGTKPPENLLDKLCESKHESKKRFPVTQFDLVRTPNIRKNTLIIFIDWFVVNMAYYGLTLSTSNFGVDVYIVAFVSGAIDLPSYLFCWYAMERFGRRLTLSAFYVTGGLSCLMIIFVPLGAARTTVAMVGKFAISAAFVLIYMYSCELYPTVIRSTGMGASSTVARFSGILCPLILILGKYWQPLPFCIFGGSCVITGILTLRLPETLGCHLPDTIKDGENVGKGPSFRVCYKVNLQGETADPIQSHVGYVPLVTPDKPPTEPTVVIKPTIEPEAV